MIVLHLDEQTGWRGGEQQASYLIEGLVRRGHTCLIAGRPGSPFLTRSHGVPDSVRIALPFRGEADLFTAWRLAEVMRKHRVDIVHAHTSHTHTLACLARRLSGRGRVVVSRRVDFPPRPSVINRWKYHAPDRTVAISGAIRRILIDFGLPPERVDLVYSGVDSRRLAVEPHSRASAGLPELGPIIGNVAALVGHKDQATLLRAFARIHGERPDARLVIVGEGPLRSALETQCAALGLQNAAYFLGYREDVPRLLPLFNIFVLSSREEGLGTSVLDAMMCGVPVVATDAGGIPEMVRDGVTGRLVPKENPEALANAALSLLANPDVGRALAAAAKTMAIAEFSVDAMVDGNIRVYETLFGG